MSCINRIEPLLMLSTELFDFLEQILEDNDYFALYRVWVKNGKGVVKLSIPERWQFFFQQL